MNRQPQAGQAFILGNDTYSKMIRALKIKKPTPQIQGDTETNIISVVNDSGGNLELGQVVEVSDSFINDHADESFSESNLFTGDTPTADSTKLAILQEPIASTEVGDASISGVATALINITSTSHKFAIPNASSTLQSADSGSIEILDSVTSTGEKLYKVRFQGAATEGSKTDYAVFDFAYTDDVSQIATNSNQFTTDESVIRITPTIRMETAGDFLYFVEGWMEYEFPEEIEYHRIQTGSTSFTDLTAGSSTSQTINLGYSFTPSYPYVTAMIAQAANSIPWGNGGIPILTVFGEAASSFKLGLTNKHASESTGVVQVQWIATELAPKYDMISASKLKADVSLRSGSGTIHETVEVRGTDRITDESSSPNYKVPFCFHGWANAPFTGSDAELLIKVIKGSTNPSSILNVSGTVTIIKADSIANDYEAASPP